MEEKIQPCPFCESEDVEASFDQFTFSNTNITITDHYVICNKCLASGSRKMEKNDAIKIWNDVIDAVRKHANRQRKIKR